MQYLHGLVALSLAFPLVERLAPARPQPILRPGFARDVLHLVVNGWVFPLALAWLGIDLIGWAVASARPALARLVSDPAPLARAPAWLQVLLALVVLDLVKWCAHVLLHRVPLLWRIHRRHHSLVVMDWIGNWRFNALEIVYYQLFVALPLALLMLLGLAQGPLLVYFLLETAVGNLNHANIRLDLGSLHRVFNGPRMHIWHHDRFPERGRVMNFAIVLSLWDTLFKTAKLPDHPPRELGIPDYPTAAHTDPSSP